MGSSAINRGLRYRRQKENTKQTKSLWFFRLFRLFLFVSYSLF
jgi:hypothetical protein